MSTKHFPALTPSLFCHNYCTRGTACATELELCSQAVTCHVINSGLVLIIGEQKEEGGKSARGEGNANMMVWDWMLKAVWAFLVQCKFAFFFSLHDSENWQSIWIPWKLCGCPHALFSLSSYTLSNEIFLSHLIIHDKLIFVIVVSVYTICLQVWHWS